MKKYRESGRRKTREVYVGNIAIGGDNPVRVQSMTTSSTRDVEATVEQIKRLSDIGCEIARVTVQGKKEADACREIKNSLMKQGYTIPLVADIHFYPPAAMQVAPHIDKIRINPGNFADKRASFKILKYDDASYAQEKEGIKEKFVPLIQECKKYNVAMRIGTNHGSLSDRIMNRYGDTPNGMVESAMEYAEICRTEGYHQFIFSMKASNPLVMIQAYRLLTAEMYKRGWDYPLHLGVTEAGEGEDGRIKSAIGIGSLLLDGLGDTIRVSLTEDPWYEIDPCQRLVKYAEEYLKNSQPFLDENYRKIDSIDRRVVEFPKNVAMHKEGSVIIPLSSTDWEKPNLYEELDCKGDAGIKLTRSSADAVLSDEPDKNTAKKLLESGVGVFSSKEIPGGCQVLTLSDARKVGKKTTSPLQVIDEPSLIALRIDAEEDWEEIFRIKPAMIFLAPEDNRLHFCRKFYEWICSNKIQTPIILDFSYSCSTEDLVIHASAEIGALLADGVGEGVCIRGDYDPGFIRSFSFNLLQGVRMRTIKTEFISCPSCGRTLFDLQDVTKRIRARTTHLPGVKIAIMGCIVNGPGEMADAHFGYVGSRPGMIDLYVGKERVEKNIPFKEADDRLVELIKKHDRWVEVPV